MRWGLLGGSRISRRMATAIAVASEDGIVAVGSRSAGSARQFGNQVHVRRAHSCYEALVADELVDAVYVSVPNSLHYQWTQAALSAGKHVLCEKPLAPDPDDAAYLFNLARTNRLLLMEGFMYRHHPQTRAVLREIHAGTLGDLRQVTCTFHVEIGPGDIRYRPDLGGGALADVGCYGVNLAVAISGSGPEVGSATAHWSSSGVEVACTAELRLPSGAGVAIDCSIDRPYAARLHLEGSEGSISVRNPWLAGAIPEVNGRALEPAAVRVGLSDGSYELEIEDADPYALEIMNFEATVAGRDAPVVSQQETLATATTLIGIREALTGGSTRR